MNGAGTELRSKKGEMVREATRGYAASGSSWGNTVLMANAGMGKQSPRGNNKALMASGEQGFHRTLERESNQK